MVLGGVSAVPSLGSTKCWLCKPNGQLKPHGLEQHRLVEVSASKRHLFGTDRGCDDNVTAELRVRVISDVRGTRRVTWSKAEAGHRELKEIHGRDFQGKMLLSPEKDQDFACTDTFHRSSAFGSCPVCDWPWELV